MRKILLFAFFIPAAAIAQVKPLGHKAMAKKPATAVKKATVSVEPARPEDGFLIKGDVSGIADGTTVVLLNGSTGAQEQTSTVQKGRFYFAGKLASPDFKLLSFNSQPPYITMFIDNSTVTVTAAKDNLDNAVIKGSPAEDAFAVFMTDMKPYEDLLAGKGRFNLDVMDRAATVMENFVTTHPDAFITPFALVRLYQLTGDYAKLESLYNSMNETVKVTPIGGYIAHEISVNKEVSYGKPVADFSQADTSGNSISLSSFKGKYVLVDFWASWCGPCRAENPNVVNMYAEFKNKNFTVLGVSLDRAKAAWVDAINADGLAWTNVSDLKFWGNAVAVQFGIVNIPQNMLIDPDGNLVAKNLRGAALEYRLSKVLK